MESSSQNLLLIDSTSSIYLSENKGFCLCNSFVLNKIWCKLCLIGVSEKIGKERGTAYTYRDLLKSVPSKQDKYVMDKELLHTDDFIFCVALHAFRA